MNPRVSTTRATAMCRKTHRSRPRHERRSDGAADGMGDDGLKAAGGPDGRSGKRVALCAAIAGTGGRRAAE